MGRAFLPLQATPRYIVRFLQTAAKLLAQQPRIWRPRLNFVCIGLTEKHRTYWFRLIQAVLAHDWSICVPYEPHEIGHGTDDGQDVVIWQSVARVERRL
jgi:hypothetical protein